MTRPDAPGPPPWRVIFRGGRGRLAAGLLLAELVIGMQSLVVTTVLPVAATELTGLQLYGLAFAVYAAAQLATLPVGGSWSDRTGPRTPFLVGAALTTAGLLLAGAAPTFGLVVVARAVEGLGAGLQYAVAFASIAKGFPPAWRPRLLSLNAAMWIAPALLGPPVGSLITAVAGWRWAFFGFVPVLLVAVVLVAGPLGSLPATAEPDARLPWRASVVGASGVGALTYGLTLLADHPAPGWSLVVVGTVAAGVALRRLWPVGTWRARRGLPAAVASVGLGDAAYFGAFPFLTLLLIGRYQLGAAAAGGTVMVSTLAWSLASLAQPTLLRRWGSARTTRVAAAGLVAAALLLVGSTLTPQLVAVYVAAAVLGLGMGLSYPTVTGAVLSTAPVATQGSASAAGLLAGTVGSALATGIAGAVLALTPSLPVGLAVVFALSGGTALLLALVAPRLVPEDPAGVSARHR